MKKYKTLNWLNVFSLRLIFLLSLFGLCSIGSAQVTSRVFAPYIDMSSSNNNLSQISTASGIKYFTLAFLVDNGGCTLQWGGRGAMSSDTVIGPIINALRAKGGDVIISFGGAAGHELAVNCSSVSSIQAQYQAVINKYGVKALDFDIEGGDLDNTGANDRRNQALANLQAANPGLYVSYTLPVSTGGLLSNSINLLNNAKSHGLNVAVVNIMTMDFGEGKLNMGQNTIDAANATISQLNANGLTSSTLGVCDLIGVNDVPTEIFRVSDATVVDNFIQGNSRITRMSFWQVGRDAPCTGGNGPGSDTCSGVTQNQWDFSHIFEAFGGGGTSFNISASSGPSGTIAPSGNVSVAQGGSQTFTFTPNSGFAVSNVLVDSASVGTPSSYTFSNIQAGHTINVSFAATGATNLALNRPVTVSSTETASFPGSAAVDGNTTTRWSSAYADNQFITVDLGSSQAINEVKLTWETAMASHYQVQVSVDNANWTTVKEVTGNTTAVNDWTGLAATGRYVKINCLTRATQWGFSLFELAVYGTGTPPPPPTGIVAIKANINGKFVSATSAGAGPLVANATIAQGWELFDQVDLGNGLVGFRARINGKFVSATNAGAGALIASATTAQLWEQFQIVNVSGGVALKAMVNGKFVSATNAGAGSLIANATIAQGWEFFTIVPQ